jgi:hypothetical protein
MRLALAGVLVAAWLIVPTGALAAADPGFGRPSAAAEFGQSVQFLQPIDDGAGIVRAELLVTYPSALGPEVIEVDPPGAGSATLRHAIEESEDHIYPNTRLTARWRLTYEDGSAALGPETSILYEDDRFDWQTAEGDLVRVHWYEGPQSFGDRALRIAEEGIAQAQDLLGVTETEPVDFFIYAGEDALYDALGPGTRENVGGQANSDIRTLFALITPGEIDDAWVGIVIPHELTHLVFDTAVDNAYHFPPRWLNEGVAVYLSQGYDLPDRSRVESAAEDGELVPLDGLAGQFPTTADGFYLAYAESVAAVDYLVRTHGQDALVGLINSYAEGRTDDEAFEAAVGVDVTAFNAAWFADVGTDVPPKTGPQPAPPGPLPDGWSGPAPVASAAPSSVPAASPGASPTPAPAEGTSGVPPVALLLVGLAAIVAIGLVGGGFVLSQRRRRLPQSQAGTDTLGE